MINYSRNNHQKTFKCHITLETVFITFFRSGTLMQWPQSPQKYLERSHSFWVLSIFLLQKFPVSNHCGGYSQCNTQNEVFKTKGYIQNS